MIAGFPVVLLLPGILFLAAGIFYRKRALAMDGDSDLARRLALANRTTGNLALIFGVALLAITIPLGIAIKQLG